jgi:phage repressor protein C with HTH and peptisase S24 domain
MQSLQQRMAECMRRHPELTQADIARHCGVSTPSVHGWVHGDTRSLKPNTARLAAQLFGCDQNWLAIGVGTPRWREAGKSGPAHIELDGNPAYPSIRRVRFKLHAGVSGFAVQDLEDDGPPIVFRRDWFDLHGYRPEKMLAARVAGASMEPSLWDGDLVVINTAQTTPHDGHVYALNIEGVLAIKRLVRDGGEWWIRSDNADKVRYPDKRTHEGVSVLGEVVYKQSERI